jgi:hypothetical protein
MPKKREYTAPPARQVLAEMFLVQLKQSLWEHNFIQIEDWPDF